MSDPLPVPATSNTFERIKRVSPEGHDFWSARDLARVLEYTDFRNFIAVITKAREACAKSGHAVSDHFVDINEMVSIGSGAQRALEDWALSRYACYLVIQNADPGKPLVALGQSYFAVQTRRQELADAEALQEEQKRLLLRGEMKRHNKNLAGIARQSGVVQPVDYAVFMDHGYCGLYGGLTRRDIHARKRLKPQEHILDHMGSLELAAKFFASRTFLNGSVKKTFSKKPAEFHESITSSSVQLKSAGSKTRSRPQSVVCALASEKMYS